MTIIDERELQLGFGKQQLTSLDSPRHFWGVQAVFPFMSFFLPFCIKSPKSARLGGLGAGLSAFLVISSLQAAPQTKNRVAASNKTKIAVAKPMMSRAGLEYLLGPEDVLEVSVSNHPDLNATVTVRPDGRITLPRAGEITARGKSARVLAAEIQRVLSRSLNNARVQVLVKQARVVQARITGAVKVPGAYPIKNGARVFDLIGAAGGLSTKPTRIAGRILRSNREVKFNLPQAVAQPSNAANLALSPDDLVILDAQDFARQITVTGSVAKPGAYDLEEDLTLTALLAQAGGPLPGAALRKSSVLRDGVPVLTDFSSAINGNAKTNSALARFEFKAGDVVFVPENLQRFGVMGQVGKPNYYALPEDADDATVLKALAQAGGALPDGDLSEATITRIFNGQTKVLSLDAEAMFLGRAPDNIRLQNDDVLLIPKRNKQVFVSGQVLRPGPFSLGANTTLLSLLAEAGNPIKNAGLSRAFVLRGGLQIPIDLRAAVVDQKVDENVQNFRLQRGDTLVIPDVSELVQVNGQVARPGPYSLDDNLTLISLLTKAGNATPDAALSQAYVQRGATRISFDLRAAVAGNVEPQVAAFQFEPNDVLVVPQNTLRITVLGEVLRPGKYPFPENPRDASILNILTAAGGPTNGPAGANLGEAGILRTTNGQAQIIQVDLNKLLRKADISKNIQLLPEDVLFIPPKKRGFKLADLLGPVVGIATIGRGF